MPFEPVDNAKQCSIPGKANEKQNSTEMDTAISTNWCNNSASKQEIFSCEMKKAKETNIVDSKVGVQTENSCLNDLKPNQKNQKKMEINLEDSTKILTEPVRQDRFNSNALERKSDWFQGGFSKNAASNFREFVNFSNESDNGNMPVILNVFTLSQEPAHIKKKTTNVICESTFPVTPPCSPPLLKLEQFTAAGQLTTLEKAATTSNLYNISCPGKSVQKSMIPGAHIFPTEMKDFVHHGNYTPERKITQLYNVKEGAKRKDSKFGIASVSKVNVVLSGYPPPAVRKLNANPFKSSPVTEVTETTSYSSNKCFSESKDGLTPREVKVLQLKRKLEEQEAALKKLRANH